MIRNLLTLCLFLFLIITGCQPYDKDTSNGNYKHGVADIFEPTIEDIVDTHGTVTNEKRLLTFLDNVEKGKEDQIRIVRYTVEGAPILHNIAFDGTAFTLTVDNSRDGFGGGTTRTVNCNKIDVRKAENSTNYLLIDCDSSYNEQILEVY